MNTADELKVLLGSPEGRRIEIRINLAGLQPNRGIYCNPKNRFSRNYIESSCLWFHPYCNLMATSAT
jgi:hypothetical protein